MPGQFVARRYGQDTPSRIAATSELLMEASEIPPMSTYQTLVPFYPPSITAGGSATSTGSDDEIDTWKQFPGRLDLYSYQGDDVMIPLYFSDPTDPTLDMSDETGSVWKAQVRTLHTYRSTLLWEFAVESSYIPPQVPEDPTSLGVTQVTLFMPRYYNKYLGRFRWDVGCISPYAGPVDFAKPADYPEGEPWPPEDSLRTWLYGLYYSVPRVTATDWLPPPGAVAVGPGTQAQFFSGPNGRVP